MTDEKNKSLNDVSNEIFDLLAEVDEFNPEYCCYER